MIPKYNEMYNEVLQVLNRHEEIKYRDMVEEVMDLLNLSFEDRNMMLANGKSTVIYYRLGWTRTYLSKAGLMEAVKRGVYKITNEGKHVLIQNVNVTNKYMMKYPAFAEFIQVVAKEDNKIEKQFDSMVADDETPNEKIENAISIINSRLRSEIIETIMSKPPIFFEQLVLDLLREMGYAFDENSVIRTAYVGDEGIDGIIEEDSFGFSSIYVQAKRWQETSPVGRKEIQSFLGAVAGQGGTKGLFITTSRFTKEAIDYARKQLQVKLVLIDGEKLADLMIKYEVGVSTVKTYKIKQIDMDYFETDIS